MRNFKEMYNALAKMAEQNENVWRFVCDVLNGEDIEPQLIIGQGRLFVLSHRIPSIDMLETIWFGSGKMSDCVWRKNLGELYRGLIGQIKLQEFSVRAVAGRSRLPDDDDAIHVAWQIKLIPERELYFIKVLSARYHNSAYYVYSGNLDDYFSVERIGRLPRSDCKEEMLTMEQVSSIIGNLRLNEFGDAFYKAINSGVIRFKS